MTKGINNWREAFWMTVILAWMGVILATLVGVTDVTVETVTLGTKAIIIGMMVHVIWANFSGREVSA